MYISCLVSIAPGRPLKASLKDLCWALAWEVLVPSLFQKPIGFSRDYQEIGSNSHSLILPINLSIFIHQYLSLLIILTTVSSI